MAEAAEKKDQTTGSGEVVPVRHALARRQPSQLPAWERELDGFLDEFRHFFNGSRLFGRERRWPFVEERGVLPTLDV